MTLTHTIFEPSSGCSREEQHHVWQTAMRDRLTELELRPGERFRGHGAATALDLGDLLVTDWRCPADLEGLRRGDVAAREAESLMICSVTSGRQLVETLDESRIVRPGVMLIMSTRTACRIEVPEDMCKRTLRVPMSALASHDTGQGIPDFLCIDTASSPLARLSEGFLRNIEPQLGHMTGSDIEGARSALLVLVAGMLRSAHAPDASHSDFLPFLRTALEDWIASHLSDGVIRAGQLAAAHNVAPRTVHRAFATTGDTMGSVVRARRLAAARQDLVHTTSSIAAIAHRWGFCDTSHLGREFRREFSMSPGDYRAVHGIVS